MRLHRAKNGKRMFEAAELRKILNAAGRPLRAMILLACNTGFGNNDVSSLPLSALDLAGGWVDFPQPKTGILRRCPLWPETVDALRDAITHRPAPKTGTDDAQVFLTRCGTPWVKCDFETTDGNVIVKTDDALSKEMSKLLKALKLKKPGLNFYTLRHVFETVGGESRDQPAVNAIMGHAADDMASVYREGIGDDRLKAVADHVRGWLFCNE
jgi:integrase